MSDGAVTRPTKDCPSADELANLGRQKLPEDRLTTYVSHLSACPRCAETLRNAFTTPQGEPADRVSRLAETREFEHGAAGAALAPKADDHPVEPHLSFRSHLVLGTLGEGGMGVVYDAWDLERGTRVALKALPRIDPAALYRFKREFRARADLVHPNLVNLYELVGDEDQWFFTMDRIEGTDFLSYVRGLDPTRNAPVTTELASGPAEPTAANQAPTEPEGPLPRIGRAPPTQEDDNPTPPLDEARLREALRQLMLGLQAVHDSGLLHRDIKPSNVMVRSDGRVVLLDFGLVSELASPDAMPCSRNQGSTPIKARNIHDVTRPAGTVDYMAPEQAIGTGLTPACDWYGVGVMVYEALTGRRPFTGTAAQVLRDKVDVDPPSPESIAPGTSTDWSALCMRLLARRPEERAGARELWAFLNRESAPDGSFEDGNRFEPLGADSAAAEFVGRADALRQLEDALDQACRNEVVLQFVHGPSGVGKSTLLQHFLKTASDRVSLVLQGRCHEQESVPYKAVDALIDDLTRRLQRRPAEANAALAQDGIRSLATLFPVLRRVPGLMGHEEAIVALDSPHELKRRAFEGFRALIAELARVCPLILVVDDLQWGDAASARLLGELLRPPRLGGVLVLILARDEQSEHNDCLRDLKALATAPAIAAQVRELNLRPLEEAEARRFVRAALGTAAGDEPRVETIVREARGNPFFLHELTKHARDAGARARLESGRALDLDEVLWSRITALSEDARLLLEVLAVAGQPTSQRVAHQAAGLLPGRERAAAMSLRSERFARGTGPRLDDLVETFHDRVRVAVLDRMAPQTRSRYHGQLAIALEAEGVVGPETLASHFRAAGERERAGHYYELAGDHAIQALAFDHAARHYQFALEAPLEPAQRAGLRRKRADALANAGLGLEAAGAYLECAAEAPGADWMELHRRAGYHFATSGHLHEARVAFDAILEPYGLSAQRAKARTLCSILAQMAWLRLRGLRYRERPESDLPRAALERLDVIGTASLGLASIDPYLTVDFQLRCLRMALQQGRPREIAHFLALHATAISARGASARAAAFDVLRRAEEILERHESPHGRALVDLATGITEFHASRWKAALEALDRAQARMSTLDQAQRATWTWERMVCDDFKTHALMELGRFPELGPRVAGLRASARELGDHLSLSAIDTIVGTRLHLIRDEPDDAWREVDAVLSHWPRDDYLLVHFRVLAARVLIDLYREEPLAAVARLTEEWPALRRSLILRSEVTRARTVQLRALAWIAAARRAASPRPYLKAAARDADRLGRERASAARAGATLVRAAIAACPFGPARAADLFLTAADHHDACDMPIEAHAARMAAGRLIPGLHGENLDARGAAGLRSLGVVRPDRYARLLTSTPL